MLDAKDQTSAALMSRLTGEAQRICTNEAEMFRTESLR